MTGSFGPMSPEEFRAAVNAPFGGALKAIRKFDPFYGLTTGEVVKHKVRLTKQIEAEAWVTVEATSEEEALELAEHTPESKIDWDHDDSGCINAEEAKPIA